MECKICDNKNNNKVFKVKEMMFGFNDFFDYFECSKCGCLQITEIPQDTSKYYPSNYYSYHSIKNSNVSKIMNIVRKQRDKYALTGSGIIGFFLNKIYPAHQIDLIIKENFNLDSEILEVGCGSGNLIRPLGDAGFKRVLGIDPFIKEDVEYNNGVKILKKTIHELPDSQKFDLIIFNHSIEHIPSQLETLIKISKILSENGVCLIRMPIKTEYIWNRYSVNWVQIDCPRHFFIHTLKSFELLVKKSGLVIQDVIFESDEFQFWGSEQYKRDIPLAAGNSYSLNPKKSIFTGRQIKEFRNIAKELNKNKQGDSAAFYIMKA